MLWREPDNDPPIFAVVSADDPIADDKTMYRRIQTMKKAGIDARLMRFRHAGHGFGTGVDTDAQDWMQTAIVFWREQINDNPKRSKQ